MFKFPQALLLAGALLLTGPILAQVPGQSPSTPVPQQPATAPNTRPMPPTAMPGQRGVPFSTQRPEQPGMPPQMQMPGSRRFPITPPTPATTPKAPENWLQKLPQGGTTTIVQILLSMIGGAFALERLFGLRRKAIAPAGLAQQANELWQAGKLDEIEKLCRENPSTLASIISFTVRHRTSSLADVSLIAGDIASREIGAHMQRAYPLAVVATLEPLLGLLGTVLGMIESFDVIVRTATLADPVLLADGISKALITTAVGLIIAIPFLGLYHYFRSRTNSYATILEAEATELISEWLLTKPGGDNARPAT